MLPRPLPQRASIWHQEKGHALAAAVQSGLTLRPNIAAGAVHNLFQRLVKWVPT